MSKNIIDETISPKPKSRSPFMQRVLTGALTLVPIWLTYWSFKFILGLLSDFGMPWVEALSDQVLSEYPNVAGVLLDTWFRSAIAVISTLAFLYFLGWAATWVIGQRLLSLVDNIIEHIPVVKKVYGAAKKLMSALQGDPRRAQRVALIRFPSNELLTVGLVTATYRDPRSGEEYSAIYVPTTPNPTGGYLQLVPTARLIPTDWSFDEAMSFILSGGAMLPKEFLGAEQDHEKKI